MSKSSFFVELLFSDKSRHVELIVVTLHEALVAVDTVIVLEFRGFALSLSLKMLPSFFDNCFVQSFPFLLKPSDKLDVSFSTNRPERQTLMQAFAAVFNNRSSTG